MSGDRGKLPERAGARGEVDSFLRRLAAAPAVRPASGRRGRLLFALDATASRQPTWDRACQLQAEMFREAASLGGLDIQLVYYRGFGEFEATPWLAESDGLLRRMTAVTCLGGHTQIAKVLRHAVAEARREKVAALVFVGDCMEEDIDTLCHHAGELGVLGVPAFVFHEGHDPIAVAAFEQIARLSGGAYCRFDTGSAQQLRDLLRAVAVFAAGGMAALTDYGKRVGGEPLRLAHRMASR
jgi:hypothetical protein